MTLYALIKRIYNGLISIIVEDVLGNMLEALYNFVLIQGEEYDSLAKYLEVSNHQFTLLKQTGFKMATESLRDKYMKELMKRRQEKSEVYRRLQLWDLTPDDAAGKVDIDKGKEALNQVIRARNYVYRAGKDFNQF